jgi:sulfide:quinone oxidoreductase
MTSSSSHVVVIVGGGAGGATVAALLLKQQPDLDIAVIEPSDTHWYQPAWTLVGAGAFKVEATGRPMEKCLPKQVTRIKARVSGFAPERNEVLLEDGRSIGYGQLVVAAGIQLDWNKIEGLEATLGKNGVTSNYRPDLAPYTWECIQAFKGGKALFTQPAMPIKCAGAPQKILYMAADRLRESGRQGRDEFLHARRRHVRRAVLCQGAGQGGRRVRHHAAIRHTPWSRWTAPRSAPASRSSRANR